MTHTATMDETRDDAVTGHRPEDDEIRAAVAKSGYEVV